MEQIAKPHCGARLDRLPDCRWHSAMFAMVAFGLLVCWSNAVGGLILAQLKVLGGQLDALLSTLENNAVSIDENSSAIELQIAQVEDRLAKCRIASPVTGTVLAKYAEAGELASVGRPLMKVADLDRIYLRAYFTSDQLADLRLGQEVTVTADFGGERQLDYPGRIVWIASESEFTPKTVQTRNSRAGLVYAAKIAVENDGRLKIGLYGEVKL